MESSLLFIIFMAVVQGIAEFLPISSSGHLAVMGKLFGFDAETNAVLNITLHGGTLVAIVFFYFKELMSIVRKRDHSLITKLIVATVPAGASGFLMMKMLWDESIFNNLFVPGIGFIITASILLWGQKSKENKNIEKLTLKQSFFIGLAQAVALLPGVSRAGSTISAGLKCGLNKGDAACFSFLMAIPAIGGVVFIKILILLKNFDGTLHSLSISHLTTGFIVSVFVGYFSLRLLLKLLKRGDFKNFAWYLYTMGVGTLIWAFIDACV